MTTCLPFDILTAIFEKVDDVQDLRKIRTASRTFCAVAAPIAFRILSVKSTVESAQNIGRLFDISEIAAYVKEVTHRDTEKSLEEQRMLARTGATHELASLFSRIHQLPQLETIDLIFSQAGGCWLRVDGSDCSSLQRSILVALASSFSFCVPPKLISLSLRNLRTWDLTPLEWPPFQAVLRNLRRLRLSVLFDRAHDIFIALDRWSHFWGTLCAPLILAPTQHTLTELTLHTNVLVGASMGLSFTGLYFQNLRVLSLRKFVFEPSVGVEPFILQHAATLARLELISCKTLIPNNEEPSCWGRIWDSFATGLTALVALHVDESERRYVCHWHHGRVSYVSYIGKEATAHVDVADAAALERFYVTVAARSEAPGAS